MLRQVGGSLCLEVGHGIDPRGKERHVGEERRPGVFEGDFYRGGIGRINLLDRGEQIGPELLGLPSPIKIELHISRGQQTAVVKVHAGTQMKRIHGAAVE